jgi:hypothetical protein
MTQYCIIPVVEGHGEVIAVPMLLRRIWQELLAPPGTLEVLKPLREKRMRMTRDENFGRFVELALAKLKSRDDCGESLVLVLLDRDPAPEPPCAIAPKLIGIAARRAPHARISIVIANVEYETWFVAAADSLRAYLTVEEETAVDDPEAERKGKAWVAKRFRGTRYSETQDQPRLTAAMDLRMCRSKSPSFDKLCREIEVWVQATTPETPPEGG